MINNVLDASYIVMKIEAVKTCKIKPNQSTIFDILDRYLLRLEERSIVAVTSKIVAICEGNVVKKANVDKKELIESEAEYILPMRKNKYDITLTLKRNILIPTAGIDESNGAGYYILWPKDPQKSANEIRKYLRKKLAVKKVGVIITDSKTVPLRRGTSGVSLAHSGFLGLNSYIGRKDIFGSKLKVTNANIMDGLAAAAVLAMGEGKEQTPLAIITDIPFAKFKENNPSERELNDLKIELKDDLYAPLLINDKWKKAGKRFLTKKAKSSRM